MKILKTGALLILLSVLLVTVGGYIGGANGMKVALAIAVVINGVSYFYSDKIALASSGAQPVTREQLPRLYAVMERLRQKLISRCQNFMSCRRLRRMPLPPAAIRGMRLWRLRKVSWNC